jgi:hypothetical protein
MTPSPSNPKTPQEQLAKIQQDLEALRARSVRSTWATLLLGALVLTALAVYFVVGYQQINAATDPEQLVSAAEAMLDERLPQVRKTAGEEIKKAAPQLAASASKQLQEAIPAGRKRLENYTLDQIDETLKESQLLSEQQFTAYLRANRPVLEAKFKELAANDRLAEKSLDELALPLEAQLAPDLRAKAQESIYVLLAMNDKLARLKDGKGLSPDEQVERRILMTVRRLQTERVDPGAITLAQPAGGPALQK